MTANTLSQLETKTWAELAKWKKRCVVGHRFNLSPGKMSMRLSHKDDPDNWRCDAMTCKEENSEAFAGQYVWDTRCLIEKVVRRASPIVFGADIGRFGDDATVIRRGRDAKSLPWKVLRNGVGPYREIFGKFRHRWITRQIDSRDAKLPNKAKIAEWVNDYGEDSDFVRVRVRGVFPRAGSLQFIASDVIDAAASREDSDLVSPIMWKAGGRPVALDRLENQLGERQLTYRR